MDTVDILSTKQLRAANEEADRRNLNRVLADQFLERLRPDGVHVINFKLLHDDRWGSAPDEAEWRCLILASVWDQDDPVECWLDIAVEDYGRFTRAIGKHDDGEWRFLTTDGQHGWDNAVLEKRADWEEPHEPD